VQDTKLFEAILGIQAPWRISRVALDTTGERVDLWRSTRTPAGRARSASRRCRVTITPTSGCGVISIPVTPDVPPCARAACRLTHGVRQVRVPWAETRSRFTLLMERLIIDLIQQCSTVTGACRIARVTWDEAWGVMDRAVVRGRARKVAQPIPYIGVDEKAFRKGHRYHTLVCDLERSTVEFVAEDRRHGQFDRLLPDADARPARWTESRSDGHVGAVYHGDARGGCPEGAEKIVFDRCHIMREMTKAVDTVRKHEHRDLLRAGDSPLTGTKYLWLFSDERRPDRHAAAFATLQALNLKVGRACALKEALRTLWTYRQTAAVTRFFSQWYGWAMRSL
jgi:transposase